MDLYIFVDKHRIGYYLLNDNYIILRPVKRSFHLFQLSWIATEKHIFYRFHTREIIIILLKVQIPSGHDFT